MTPTELHETLDRSGWLDDAHGSGTYALEVPTPNAVEAVQRAWLDTHGTPLPDDYAQQLAEATTTLYVGASKNSVYDRVMDHAEGKVRRASFVQAFGFTDVRGVWPGSATGVTERDRARAESDAETCVWCDGALF